MQVVAYKYGPFRTNGYIVFSNGDAVLIDPPAEHTGIVETLQVHSLTIRALLCTHLHFDHVFGFAYWQKATGLNVLAGAQDIACKDAMLARAKLRGITTPILPFETESLIPGRHEWGALCCDVLHVPGHSPGSLCYYFAKADVLFSGDTLFHSCIGRTDFPESQPEIFEDAIKSKLLNLPTETRVFPGHGKMTTIAEELPRFQYESP